MNPCQSNPKTKIFAAIIGKNEEAIVARCLKSLKGFDGIYFTDTGSTDRTLQIVEAFTDKISHFKWCDDFSKARNFGLDLIPKNEWVFIIDCDEWLPAGEIHKIRAAAAKSKTGACFAHVKNLMYGGEHQHLRFFKNNLRYKDAWHTHIPVKHFEFSDVVLNHEPSPNHKKDPNRNFRIAAKIKNKTPRMKYMLARELLGHAEYAKSVRLFQQYLKEAPTTQEMCEVLTCLSQALFQLGRNYEAQNAALAALNINPEYKEALITMASVSEPWKMRAWIRYAKAATNYGTINIHGKQDDKIADLEKLADLSMKGKTINEIEKILDKKKTSKRR